MGRVVASTAEEGDAMDEEFVKVEEGDVGLPGVTIHEAKGIQLIVKQISNILNPNKDLKELQPYNHLKIPFNKISSATNNFSNLIGEGGFGKVYRGVFENLGMVAVKKLNEAGGQGNAEFLMEIELLSTIKHKNIVSLVGFCSEDDQRILVYKYEVNGSLHNHIRKEDLTWIQRLRICFDAANGLKHLHEDVRDQKIIFHRDIKCANILLDENKKAKISDFGLSKVIPANVIGSVITSSTCGTPGYVDPQYDNEKRLSQKSDVYSFGVVLFEVLFSKSIGVQEGDFTGELARDRYGKKALDEIIVPSLRIQMDLDCLSTYSTIAYQCLNEKQDERPTMSKVVDQLKTALDYQRLSVSRHDVYICYTPRDPECHVVNTISAELHKGRFSTYKDEVTLFRGESVLLKAIKRSRLFVILFTKMFAVNSWHLDEVANIIESMKENRHIILPVFLNVSSADVRMQKGDFGEVMSEYDRHPRMEIWRNALIEATNAPGLEYSKFRSSADLVKKVVEDIKIGLSTEYLSTLKVSGQSA